MGLIIYRLTRGQVLGSCNEVLALSWLQFWAVSRSNSFLPSFPIDLLRRQCILAVLGGGFVNVVDGERQSVISAHENTMCKGTGG